MKKILYGLLIFIHICNAQQEPDLFSELKKSFVAFEYEKTIAIADRMLLSKDNLPGDVLVEVLRMQAIAYYSLDKLDNSENSFIQMLEIKPNYTLSESETSPKIIVFYDKIKVKYLSEQMSQSPAAGSNDKKQLASMKKALEKYKAGMLRSLVLPGWGHYYVNESGKGLILNLGSLLTLAPGIYYAIKTEEYEQDYLNESYDRKIESSYRKYNNAYKNRNYFLSAFAVIWLYSQYDYFFTDHNINSDIRISLNTNTYNHTPQIQFAISF